MIDTAFNFIYTIIASTVTWLTSNYISNGITIGALILGLFMFETFIKALLIVK